MWVNRLKRLVGGSSRPSLGPCAARLLAVFSDNIQGRALIATVKQEEAFTSPSFVDRTELIVDTRSGGLPDCAAIGLVRTKHGCEVI